MKNKIDLNKQLIFVKVNLALILVLPSVLGGIWQLIELESIDISFIRFFSISQVVSDGLLILYVLSVIYFSFKMGIFISSGRLKEERNFSYKINLFFLPVVMSFLIYISVNKFYLTKKVDFFSLSIFLFASVILFKYVIDIIGKSKIINFVENSWIRNLVIPILLPFTLVGSLFFISFSLQTFHDSVYLPQNLLNVKNFEKKLDDNYLSYKILYLNDKYIFIELIDSNKNKKIKVVQFEALFDED